MQVWFQPQVDLASGQLRGLLALDRDAAVPSDGLLHQAIEALQQLPAPLFVGVELNAAKLDAAALVESVGQCLRPCEVAPERLHLHIHAAALMPLPVHSDIDTHLQRLAELGVRLVLTGLGETPLTLSSVCTLPFYAVQLSGSCAEGVGLGHRDSRQEALALAGLALGLGWGTVAGGIDRPDQAQALLELGWQEGVGQALGAPAPLEHWQRAAPSLLAPAHAIGRAPQEWLGPPPGLNLAQRLPDPSDDLVPLRVAIANLAASEEHFRLLAENMSDVVFRLDLQGRITWVSPSLTPTLGWQPEDWMGQVGTRFLVHGGEAAHYQANLQLLQQGGSPPIAREQIFAKDGSIHWVETHASPSRNGQGQINGVVASFRVIDATVAAEEELRRSEERYRLLAENALDVIWTMEPDGSISYVSPSIRQLRGVSPEEAMQQNLDQIHPLESRAKSQAYFGQLLADLAAGRPVQPFRGELEYYCRDGTTIWADVIALPRLDEQGRLVKLLGVSRNITERKRFEQQLQALNAQLEALSISDPLTGIGNRRHFEAVIREAMDRADRYGNPLALILCDIDFFKAINDNHGHHVGDQVLIEFTQRIQHHLRRSDFFGRWGGEEFILLLPNSDAPAAMALAEELRQRMAGEPFPVVGSVTASFGVAQRLPNESEANWLRRVDDSLYAAKEAGRNRVCGSCP